MVHKCEGSRSVLEERNNGVEGNIRFESPMTGKRSNISAILSMRASTASREKGMFPIGAPRR